MGAFGTILFQGTFTRDPESANGVVMTEKTGWLSAVLAGCVAVALLSEQVRAAAGC